jgi:hypothetical protein
MVCQLHSFGVGSARLTVSRRFELSVTPKKVVSKGFRQGPHRITHILLPNAECIAGAPLKLVNPNLQNDFAHDFRFVGLGLKRCQGFFVPD